MKLQLASVLSRAIGPIRRFLVRQEAATSTEYAVMLALILLAIVSSIGAMGTQTGGMWAGIQSELTAIGFFR